MLELHRRLNRADVTKDAKRPDTFIECGKPMDFFNLCADDLFGPLRRHYASELLEIKNIVDSAAKIRHSKLFPKTRMPLSMLRHPLDKYVKYLPDQVTYAIQDSGLSPKHFKEDLTYVITPGSYIDAAGRSNEPRTLYAGFGQSIPKEDFLSLGFQHINSCISKLIEYDEAINQVQFTFLQKPTVTIFGTDMNPRDGTGEMLFKGNDTKNDWFNTAATSQRPNFNTGRAFILAKELGDTLQAYYGKLLARTKGQNKVCVFTSDSVLTTRCRMMELPVVVLDYDKDKKETYECYYYPAPGITDSEIIDVFETFVLSHNADVKRILDLVLRNGNCVVQQSRRLRLHDRHNALFAQITSYIEETNNKCRKFRNEIGIRFMTIDEYRIAMMKHVMPHFFIEIGDNYIANNAILIDGKKFEEALLQTTVRSGGGDDENAPLPETVFDAMPYTHYNDDVMYHLSLANQLKRRIYMVIHEYKTPNSILVPNTECIFDYAFRMFTYVGESTFDFGFLNRMIDAYKLRGEMISHEEFAEMYRKWSAEEFPQPVEQKKSHHTKTAISKITLKNRTRRIRITRRRKRSM